MSKETKINTENKDLLSEKFETKSDKTVFKQMKKEESNDGTTPYSKLKTCGVTQIVATKEGGENEMTENPENNIINAKNENPDTYINLNEIIAKKNEDNENYPKLNNENFIKDKMEDAKNKFSGGYCSYISKKNALENNYLEENKKLETKFSEENNELDNKFDEEKKQLKKKYKEERSQIDKQYKEQKNQLFKNYELLKNNLASEYKSQLQKEEDKLNQYITEIETQKNEYKKSLNKNEKLKKNVLSGCMYLRKICEDETDDSERLKTQLLSFNKLDLDNNEKKNKYLSNNEENNNKTTKGQNDKGNNVLKIERIELSINEDNMPFTQKKRNRNEPDVLFNM